MKSPIDFFRLSKKYDPSDFHRFLDEFPEQCRTAWGTRLAVTDLSRSSSIQLVVLTGLGGSAIAGEVLKNYLETEWKIPFVINRDYQLPGYVNPDSLVVVSSYSGNTEETVAAYQDAVRRKARRITLTTGGKLGELVDQNGDDMIQMPAGLPPRQAFGYSFFLLLKFFQGNGWIPDQTEIVKATVSYLEKLRKENLLPAKNSLATRLAEELWGKIPIIYGSSRTTEAVALRWKQQFAENAKVHAFVNILPEMNHNEIMAWGSQKELIKKAAVIFLEDPDDLPRIQSRQKITKKILGKLGIQIRSVALHENDKLARLIGLIYLGDWISYYLALLQRTDPIVINRIDYLKDQLGKK